MNIDFFHPGNPSSHLTVKVTDNSYISPAVMSDDTAYIEFFSTVPVALEVGDRCTLLGKTYHVRDAVIPTRDINRLRYQLTLYSNQHELEKCRFMIFDSTGVDLTAETSYYCSPEELVTALVNNMKRIQPTTAWTVGACFEGERKTIELNNNNCLEILQSAAGLWEVDYQVIGWTVYLNKMAYTPDPKQMFEVGKGKGLREITGNRSADSKMITRLYAFGSDKNSIDGQRLKIEPIDLPGAVEVIEDVHFFEEIYPRILSTVTFIVYTDEGYFIINNDLAFDPEDYRIPGQPMMITFLSGECKGLEFMASLNSEGDFACTYQQISPGVFVPSSPAFDVEVGDQFVIWNITMPQSYIDAAKAELLAAATAYLNANSNQKVKLNLVPDDIYFKTNSTELHLFENINVKSDIIPEFLTGRDVSVMGFKRYVNEPHRYENLIVGDIVFKRRFDQVITVVKQSVMILKNQAVTDGDKYYRHIQSDSVSIWIIPHYLDKRPSVVTYNTSGKIIAGLVTYTSLNSLTVTFAVPFAGYAELN